MDPELTIVVTGTRGIPQIMGGVETHCENLFPLIAKLGPKIVLIRRKRYSTTVREITNYKEIELKDIYCPRTKSLEAIVHTLLSIAYARYRKADIVHIHAIGPALLTPLVRLLGMRVVFTHHGPDYDRGKWGKLAKFSLRLGERFGTIFSNEMIVISKTIQKLTADKYNRTNTHLIPNGVAIPEALTSTNYLNKIGLQPNDYIIGVGRLVPEKAFDDLIEAYKLLKVDTKLVLVGAADHETQYSRELVKKAKGCGVILTGFIKGVDLAEIYSNAKLFVMPSYHEGLPIALLEAMSYNLPVIASDIPACLEVGLPQASYFNVGDVRDLAESISRNLKHPGEQDFHPILHSRYNWESIATQTAKVYKQAASR